MPQDGEIILENLKAYYSLEDIVLVDAKEVGMADEFRLSAEIALSIALTILGSILTTFNTILAITSGIFLAYAIINLLRFHLKKRGIKNFRAPCSQSSQNSDSQMETSIQSPSSE